MAHPPNSPSPAASTPTRYATPTYHLPPLCGGVPAAASHKQLVDWSKEQLGSIPPPSGDGNIDLGDIIGGGGVQEIEQLGEIRFHVLDDSGAGHADEAEEIANEMATDFKPSAGGLNPAFLFHLGDVLYGPGKADHYGERFYRPYSHYPGKIIAIAGNHDGEAKTPADKPSLSAFRANFCTTQAVIPQQAAGSGIYRQTMTLPGVCWCLDAPFALSSEIRQDQRLRSRRFPQPASRAKERADTLHWHNLTEKRHGKKDATICIALLYDLLVPGIVQYADYKMLDGVKMRVVYQCQLLVRVECLQRKR